MDKFVAPRIAKNNVAAIVEEQIVLNDAKEVRVTALPGDPGFYRIEAE